LSWIDILKETITQGRVKEIEDIDIDIEDDDCLRWLEKLYNIITRHPEGELQYNEIKDEESACAVKRAWGNPNNINPYDRYFYRDAKEYQKMWKAQIRLENESIASVSFLLINMVDSTSAMREAHKGGYFVSLNSTYIAPYYKYKQASFESDDIEKTKKITKEICDYLNISYDKMARGVL